MADEIKMPVLAELAKTTRGERLTDGYTDVMTISDNILTERGSDYKLYREVLRDDQVASTFQQRRLALTSKDWSVEPGGKGPNDEAAAEALKENLQEVGWDNATEKMMYAVFYGFGVTEVMWKVDGERIKIDQLISRDRSRFRFSRKTGRLYIIDGTGKYEKLPDRKFWVVSTGNDTDDDPYGRGLAHFLYWPVFFKRALIKYWMIYLEKFGMPTTIAKATWAEIEDNEKRQTLLEILAQMQTDAGIVIPNTVELELLEAVRSGQAGYEKALAAKDAAIAKVVLSQVMTTEAAGGQYKADVHKEVRDEVVEADGDLIAESFTKTVAKWWTDLNFPGAATPRVWRDTEPEEDLNVRAERDKTIYDFGFEPTEQYVNETYGEGFVKREITGPTFEQGGATGNGPEFAELMTLAGKRAGHRQDQQDLVTAAALFASKYNHIMAERIGKLLAYADETEDYATFQTRLAEMLAENPTEEAVDKVQRSGVFARLMGMLRLAK